MSTNIKIEGGLLQVAGFSTVPVDDYEELANRIDILEQEVGAANYMLEEA